MKEKTLEEILDEMELDENFEVPEYHGDDEEWELQELEDMYYGLLRW